MIKIFLKHLQEGPIHFLPKAKVNLEAEPTHQILQKGAFW